VEAQRKTVSTGDGRRLEVTITGPEPGRVVVVHTGTPSDGRQFLEAVQAGVERGLRQVSYARPGYADSDRHEGRSVADCVADVEVIADSLGIERFHVMGASGGGPHALACAALLPDRVISAATVAGAAPHDGPGLDWTAGMGAENIEEIGLAEQGAASLQPWLEDQAEEFVGASTEDVLRIFGDLVSEVDRAVLTGDYVEHVLASMRGSVGNGVWGWLDDDLAMVRSWDFDLNAIEVPVTIWHGAQDRFVPMAHGEWLAEHVPGARPRLLATEGHLSLSLAHRGDILDDLVASAM
jgi:pimeloyl-ACP methyl ester carboxylesterase